MYSLLAAGILAAITKTETMGIIIIHHTETNVQANPREAQDRTMTALPMIFHSKQGDRKWMMKKENS